MKPMRVSQWCLRLVLSLAFSFTFFFAPVARADSTPQREELLAQTILRFMESVHLRAHPPDDESSKAAFDLFLSNLDPGKLYLTEVEVAKLRLQALQLDDQWESGHLALAHEAGAIRRQRAALVAQWVQTLLAAPFDFSRKESLELRGKKRAFCPDDAALRQRWRKVLKHQLLVRILRTETPTTADDESPAEQNGNRATLTPTEAEIRAKLAKGYHRRFEYIAKEDTLDDIERFFNAVVQVYDPHTTYLSPYRKENLDIRLSGSLEGIGAVVNQHEDGVKVQRVVPGSASWRQGQLKAEDLILAVAQAGEEPVGVVDMRLRDAVQLIRGVKGSVVRLTVRKPDGKIMIIPITRDVVRLEEAYAKAALLDLDGLSGRFGYIYIPQFYGNVRGRRDEPDERRVSQDVQHALAKLQEKPLQGLILDMRSNGGGLLQEAVDVSGLFIKKGPIVQIRGPHGAQQVLQDQDKTLAFSGPMVILVDRFSASAAEIVAAALQDYGRAIVLGGITHGKGTVQHLHSLDRAANSEDVLPAQVTRLGTLKLTRYQFYRISGDSTQVRGVIPDVSLPDLAAYLDTGEGSKPYAIAWNAVEPLPYTPWPQHWDVQRLNQQSRARQILNGTFAKIKARAELLKAKQEQTLESLQQAVWQPQHELEEAELKALKPDEQKRFSVHLVPYAEQADLPEEAQASMTADWRQAVERDAWIEEALRVLHDMSSR